MLFEAAKVRNFQNLTTFAVQNRTRSLMDKIKDSGSLAQGSIPCGFTDWILHKRSSHCPLAWRSLFLLYPPQTNPKAHRQP